MITPQRIDHYREMGRTAIEREQPTGTLFHFDFDGVVFRHMFEYPVRDFDAEVGFFSGVFGFPFLALTTDYCLVSYPENALCLSFKLDSDAPDLSSLKILFMTRDIAGAEAQLRAAGADDDLVIGKGSPVQTVLYLHTPAGVQVEIWEMPNDSD